MAADINKVMLIGRLTRDAELKQLSNTAVCNFSIAVNRRVNQNGEWTDEANFFDIELFGNLGNAIHAYLKKGQQVAVEGALRQHRWDAPDGQKRSRVTISASNVQLIGGSGGNSSSSSNNSNYQNTSSNASSGDSSGQYNSGQTKTSGAPQANNNFSSQDTNDFEDDIPF